MSATSYTDAERRQLQAEVDATDWYHKFDFPGGITAKTPKHPDGSAVWRFTQAELDRIDFAGKAVLDLGCWDGYWSFYAERRGAAAVLASDDASQNWAGSRGLLLAKKLLGSRVETDLSLSVYEAAKLGRRFDIVLCLGLYYHLHDPFLAFAQLRHCLRPGGLVVVEGAALTPAVPAGTQRYDPEASPACKFTPDLHSLQTMLRGAYLEPVRHAWMGAVAPPPAPIPAPAPPAPPEGRLGWRWRLRTCWEALRGSRAGVEEMNRRVNPPRSIAEAPAGEVWPVGRLIVVCSAFEGASPAHPSYRPPLGLHQYDPRFRGPASRAA